MGEYKNDMEMAAHAFKDEVEDVLEYQMAISACKDEDLKEVFERNMADEKKHAAIILDWINKKAAEYLR